MHWVRSGPPHSKQSAWQGTVSTVHVNDTQRKMNLRHRLVASKYVEAGQLRHAESLMLAKRQEAQDTWQQAPLTRCCCALQAVHAVMFVHPVVAHDGSQGTCTVKRN